MIASKVRTPEEALVYIVDCTLATVGHQAGLKSKSLSEYRRQIAIAQKGCDWMEAMKIDPAGTRAEHIIGKQSVAQWAAQYERK